MTTTMGDTGSPDTAHVGLGTVLVTGGASGLGAAVVRAVAKAGGIAVVLDRSPLPEDVAGDAADYVGVDLADTAAAESAVHRLAGRHGLDAVVTAAGIDSCGPLSTVDRTEWERVIAVNLLGTAAVVRAALPHLKNSRGRVVTVGSTLGLRPAADATAYSAAKFGVVGFTRSLAAETAGQIGVTLLIPGGMRTAFFDGREEKYRPPDLDLLNDPADVAEIVVSVLRQPGPTTIRELVVCHEAEPSWP